MKRVVVQIMVAFALCVASTLLFALPAMAKGPSQGIITGPGLADPIRLREPGARTIGADLARVVELSGFCVGAWGGDDHGRVAQPPFGYLGPRYTITYAMGLSDRDPDRIVQYVYPFAEPVPITHMPPQQKYWGSNETVGAWYAARIGLRKTLIGLGLPASDASLRSAGRGIATAVIARHEGSIPTGSLATTVVLVLAFAAIVMRRPRSGLLRTHSA
jgi:hypothetical protein